MDGGGVAAQVLSVWLLIPVLIVSLIFLIIGFIMLSSGAYMGGVFVTLLGVLPIAGSFYVFNSLGSKTKE